MQMYVAEINGEAVVAFHASSERDAENRIAGSKGIAQDIIGVERMDGRPLWDCESPVTPPALQPMKSESLCAST
jgi:hypothetical protein